ncbi:MAG: TetR/AcrR family transcriptional regulator [Chloroflexota bacterium]
MSKDKLSKRDLVLVAASEVVIEHGAAQLTLDAVVNNAGVSKGGLLYHFPNKEALIAGMIEKSLLDFEAHLQQVYDSLPIQKGRWLKAFVIATFDDTTVTPRILAASMAAVANQPDLLIPYKDTLSSWHNKATTDDFDSQLAEIIIAATNGAWFERIFWKDPTQDRLKKHLLYLIDTQTIGDANA